MSNNIPYKEKMDYNELYEIISLVAKVRNTKIYKIVKKRFLLYFPKPYIRYMEERGLYGRTEFVHSIYLWHKKSKKKQCAIICGYAGSGKTTIIRYFEELPQMRNHCKVITKIEGIPNAGNIKKNTILFFDYAIEMREKIQRLYKSLDNKKKVTFILLERDKTEYAFKQGLDEDIDIKVFNINEEAPLSETDLAHIINYHYRYRYDEYEKEMICVNVSDYPKDLKRYVDVLVQKVDPNFRRPIFAVFLGQMLREEKYFNLEAIADQDYLCETYWEKVKSQEKYRKYEELEKMQENLVEKSVLNILIEQSKIPILIASILKIKIRISFAGKDIKWDVIEDDLHKKEFERLMSLFEQKFNKLSEGQMTFFFGLEIEKENETYYRARSGIVETESQFDLLIAWLFRNCIRDEKVKRPFLTQAIGYLSANMKEQFLMKCFRYTEDYEDNCILDYLNSYDDLYEKWSIEQYLLAIKDIIKLYKLEERVEVKKAKKESITKICIVAQKSLDNESWNVFKKNVEECIKKELNDENEYVLWQNFWDGLYFTDSNEVLKNKAL